MGKKLHIAIDGPVAAGKGTVASLLAQKLGILYVDTGAMYRAATLLGMRSHTDLQDESALMKLLEKNPVTINSTGVYIGSDNVNEEIRSVEVSRNVSTVASLPAIRAFFVEKQKEIARDSAVVMEGRDIGTIVLPQAHVKVFLTADAAVRAKRRQAQLVEKGLTLKFAQVLEETKQRDYKDMNRKTDPLAVSPGAVIIDTTHLSVEQVVDKIMKLVKKL